jgi:hypothetical protein
VASYFVVLTWVTIARVGQCLVNNTSMVLGPSSCVAYERAPRFVLRYAAVVTAVGPFVILHVRVHYKSLKSNNLHRADATRAVSSPLVPGC